MYEGSEHWSVHFTTFCESGLRDPIVKSKVSDVNPNVIHLQAAFLTRTLEEEHFQQNSDHCIMRYQSHIMRTLKPKPWENRVPLLVGFLVRTSNIYKKSNEVSTQRPDLWYLRDTSVYGY